MRRALLVALCSSFVSAAPLSSDTTASPTPQPTSSSDGSFVDGIWSWWYGSSAPPSTTSSATPTSTVLSTLASTTTTSAAAAAITSAAAEETLAEALKRIYGFDPEYELDAKATYDPIKIFSPQTWQERQMKAWSTWYISSFYNPNATDARGKPIGFFDQFLARPEIAGNPNYCTIDSDQSQCAIPIAFTPLKAGYKGSLTNNEINALLLAYSLGNWNQGFYALKNGISLAQTGADGNAFKRYIDKLLPPDAPKKDKKKDIDIFLSILDLVLLIVPEIAVVESIGARVFDKALSNAISDKNGKDASALRTLEKFIARSEGNLFANAFGEISIAETKADSILARMAKTILNEQDYRKKSQADWDSATKTIFTKTKTFRGLVGQMMKFVDEAGGKSSKPTKVTPDQLSQKALDQLADYKAKVQALYTAQRNGSPLAAGGLLDMIGDGQFTFATSNSEVANMQSQFDTYIRNWAFVEVTGGNNTRMVIFKQRYDNEDACKKMMTTLKGLDPGQPGMVCLPPNTNFPNTKVTNEHGSTFFYLFYPVAMTRYMNYKITRDPPSYEAKRVDTPFGVWNTPVCPDRPGIRTRRSAFSGSELDAQTTFIPFTDKLGDIFDPAAFYWGAWKWTEDWRLNDGEFWTVPDAGTPSTIPPWTYPVMDVDANWLIVKMANWNGWQYAPKKLKDLDVGWNWDLNYAPSRTNLQGRTWMAFLGSIMSLKGWQDVKEYMEKDVAFSAVKTDYLGTKDWEYWYMGNPDPSRDPRS